MHPKQQVHPMVGVSQLSSLPKGEVVKVQNARIPDKLVTTHSVRGKKTKQDQSPRTIYYHVAPLVDAKWKGASDPVVAWVKLSYTYSKRDPRAVMELIASKEGDDNAIKKTCTKHKLNCSDNPRLLRPLRTGFKASMLPTIMMYMSGIWVGCCGLFLLGVVVHTKFS